MANEIESSPRFECDRRDKRRPVIRLTEEGRKAIENFFVGEERERKAASCAFNYETDLRRWGFFY